MVESKCSGERNSGDNYGQTRTGTKNKKHQEND